MNREGPSALALIGVVALIVALVILVFFALGVAAVILVFFAVGYGLGRLFL